MKRAPFLCLPAPAFRVSSGFTLIEITIAITIASLALVGLLGMVPQGLRTMKMATDLAIEARINQQIVSELTQADWDKRRNYHKMVRFFDDQGIPVDKRKNQSNPEVYPIIYAARVLVPNENETLPAKLAKASGQRSQFKPFDNTGVMIVSRGPNSEFDGVQLVLLEISTSNNVRISEDFEKPANERSIKVYRTTLARATKQRK